MRAPNAGAQSETLRDALLHRIRKGARERDDRHSDYAVTAL